MDTVVMSLNGGNIEHDALTEMYGDEVMCAGWNPLLGLIGENPVAQLNKHVNLLAEAASMDAEAFLKMIYESQG